MSIWDDPAAREHLGDVADARFRDQQNYQARKAIEMVVGAAGAAIAATIGNNPYRILFFDRDRFEGVLSDLRETLERQNGLRT